MPFTTEDRRTKRTTGRLREALIQLLTKKSLNEIGIRELADLADVNRGTFYLHYKDIYDLYNHIESTVVDEICAMITLSPDTKERRPLYPILKAILDYLAQNAATVSALMRTGDEAFLTHIIRQARPRDDREWAALLNAGEAERDYCYSFISSGSVGVLRAWFDKGMSEPPQAIAAMIDKLISGSVTLFQ